MTQSLLIAGWSTRAAVQSARRAGLGVAAIDAFLDADLRREAEAFRLLTDVRRLPAIAAELPPSEWLYVGGLENHPEIVAEVSRRHRLLGTSPAALRRVRDPSELQRVVSEGGFLFPEIRSLDQAAMIPVDGGWLVKRRHSAGGIGVQHYLGRVPPSDDAYFQRFVDGTSLGVTFVAARGNCRLLGICGPSATVANRETLFRYHGSMGPLSLATRITAELQRLGDRLASHFELVGLFGVDVIVARDGMIWVVEVNPRYTASVELLERAIGEKLIELHVQACRNGAIFTPDVAGIERIEPPATQSLVYGKRIVYYDGAAEHKVNASLTEQLLTATDVADVPTPGTTIRPGDPVATVFAAAVLLGEVVRQLTERERQLLESLRESR